MQKDDRYRVGIYADWHNPDSIPNYKAKIVPGTTFIMLPQYPSPNHRFMIKDFIQVENREDIVNKNEFWVDYKEGFVYFHPTHQGEWITIKEFYGIGINRIDAKRIVTKLDATGNVVQVLQDIIDAYKEIFEALANAMQLVKDVEHSLEVLESTQNPTFIISKSKWTLFNEHGITKYKATINHNLLSKNLHITAIDMATDMNMGSPPFKYLDLDNIEVYSLEAEDIKYIISAGYYNGLVDNDRTNEVLTELYDARLGENTLKDKLLKLEDKILGINNLQYATVSTSVSPTERPSVDYDYNHIIYQGMDLVLCIMVNITKNTDYTPKIMDNSRVETVIQDAIDKGIKIQMLKPHIGLNWSDGYNRKNYTPSNLDTFFTNWTNVLLNYAEMCNKYNIPILCMSCEMSAVTVNSNLSYWKNVYDTIKSQYPNLLLLHAPKTGEFNDPNCNLTWKYSDILGVNVYLSYTYKRFTNDEEGLDIKDIAKGFYEDQRGNKVIYNINTLAEKYDKPVFITEIGCMPWDDGLIDVRCEKKVRNWYVPKYLAESAVTYLCNNRHVIGFSWWHTNTPFNYYSDEERLPLEEYFRKTFGGGV